MGSKVVIHIKYVVITYLIDKNKDYRRLIRWILLLQEFDFKVKDKKGCENQVAYNLFLLKSNIAGMGENNVNECFLGKSLMTLSLSQTQWYANF